MIEKKTSRAISRRIRSSRKPRASRIAKQQKTGHARACHRGAQQKRPNPAQPGARPCTGHARPCLGDARPCVCARPPVRLCTGGRASVHGRAVSGPAQFRVFSVFLCRFWFIFFGGPLETSLRALLGRKIRVSISLNKTPLGRD